MRQARRSIAAAQHLGGESADRAAEQHDLDALDGVGDVMLQLLNGRETSGAEADAGENGGGQRQADKEGRQGGVGTASAVGGAGVGRVHACGPRIRKNGLNLYRPSARAGL